MVDGLRLAGSFGIGLAQAIGRLVGAGDWMVRFYRRLDGWLLMTRFREIISPTAGGFALGFFALIFHVWGHDAWRHGAWNMARCGGRGGRGDCSD